MRSGLFWRKKMESNGFDLTPNKLRVIVDPVEKINETSSGIYLGQMSAEGAMRRGVVMSIGKGCSPDIKVGDEVCFMSFTGLPVLYKDHRYLSMYENEILGVIEEDES